MERSIRTAVPRQRVRPRCIFLTLPKEIRLQIYSLLLSRNSPIIVNRSTHKRVSAKPRVTPILRTCSIIHEEAADILYENSFNLSDCGRVGLMLWLQRIGARNAARINRVQITFSQEFFLCAYHWYRESARTDVELFLRPARLNSYKTRLEFSPSLTIDDTQRQQQLEMYADVLRGNRHRGQEFCLEEGLALIDIVCKDRDIRETADLTYIATIENNKYV